jgi:hypothetical protein
MIGCYACMQVRLEVNDYAASEVQLLRERLEQLQ